MKPGTVPHDAQESSTRVEFQVRFSLGPKGRRRVREAALPKAEDSTPDSEAVASRERVPKVARLLVLAHHFERLIRDGVAKDYAEIARLTGLTRARITQIVNLTLLAPEIQDAILSRPAGRTLTERSLRPLVACADWRAQRAMRKSMAGGRADDSAGQKRGRPAP